MKIGRRREKAALQCDWGAALEREGNRSAPIAQRHIHPDIWLNSNNSQRLARARLRAGLAWQHDDRRVAPG